MDGLVVIDADAHVEEHDRTFSDAYLDPAFRAARPQVVGSDGFAYWPSTPHSRPRSPRPTTAGWPTRSVRTDACTGPP
jgi:hypothetical protein